MYTRATALMADALAMTAERFPFSAYPRARQHRVDPMLAYYVRKSAKADLRWGARAKFSGLAVRPGFPP